MVHGLYQKLMPRLADVTWRFREPEEATAAVFVVATRNNGRFRE